MKEKTYKKKMAINLIIFFFFVHGTGGCEKLNQEEEKTSLSFSKEIVNVSDTIFSVSGANLSEKQLFETWVKSFILNLKNPSSGFRRFAEKSGLSIRSVEASYKSNEMKIEITSQMGQTYEGHFRDVFVSYQNKIRISAIKNLGIQLENLKKDERLTKEEIINISARYPLPST